MYIYIYIYMFVYTKICIHTRTEQWLQSLCQRTSMPLARPIRSIVNLSVDGWYSAHTLSTGSA